MQRHHSHRVETASRRKFLSMLGTDWVERELSERDYGIDLLLEHFPKGEASGDLLLVQLKGTEQSLAAATNESTIPVDVSTKLLCYSELFSVPFLLVLCSVNDDSLDEGGAYFLWLQKYVSIALDGFQSGWRNQSQVRLRIPVRNSLPDASRRLVEIAREPRFVRDAMEVLGTYRELARFVDEIHPPYLDRMKLEYIKDRFRDLLPLPVFSSDWWGKSVRESVVNEAIETIERLLACDPMESSRAKDYDVGMLKMHTFHLFEAFSVRLDTKTQRQLYETGITDWF